MPPALSLIMTRILSQTLRISTLIYRSSKGISVFTNSSSALFRNTIQAWLMLWAAMGAMNVSSSFSMDRVKGLPLMYMGAMCLARLWTILLASITVREDVIGIFSLFRVSAHVLHGFHNGRYPSYPFVDRGEQFVDFGLCRNVGSTDLHFQSARSHGQKKAERHAWNHPAFQTRFCARSISVSAFSRIFPRR